MPHGRHHARQRRSATVDSWKFATPYEPLRSLAVSKRRGLDARLSEAASAVSRSLRPRCGLSAYARLQRWLEHFSAGPRRTRVVGVGCHLGHQRSRQTHRRNDVSCRSAVAYTMLAPPWPRPALANRRAGAAISALDAHAWVECDGTVVMGELPEMTGYAMLG